MRCILTSSPCLEDGRLNPENGFVDLLKEELPVARRAVFIASDPDHHDTTVYFSELMRASFRGSGFDFETWDVLDNTNAADAAALVQCADFIVLSGGHVPTQNRFFRSIGLKELLKGCSALIIGISAGSMNSAEVVYVHPELEGEAVNPDFQRFLPGLGLTTAMLLPHLQMIRHDVLDGLRVFEDIAFPDSMGRCFYAIPDGSYIRVLAGETALCGEVWTIRDGRMEQVCEAGREIRL